MPETIYMKEDDRALVQGEYVNYQEGETYEVPGWVGRTFKSNGSAVNVRSDEVDFDPANERETKVSEGQVSDEDGRITAEPTTEGSAWYQFLRPDGTLVEDDDGDILKVQGTEKRDDVLRQLNS
jgi:hypothetical protein